MNRYFSKEKLGELTFYKIPKMLFTDKKYNMLSVCAKVLYCMLLDRASLSKENGYIDSNGNVIVFMTNSQACDLLSCSHEKASKLFKELETFNLIERKKQGLCRTLIIYPKLPS